MRHLMIIVVLLCTSALLRGEEQGKNELWLAVYYFDPDGSTERYWMGSVNRARYLAIMDGERNPQFLRIQNACYYEYNDDDQPIELVMYEDDRDTGSIAIRVDVITTIVEMKDHPKTYIVEATEPVEAAPVDDLVPKM